MTKTKEKTGAPPEVLGERFDTRTLADFHPAIADDQESTARHAVKKAAPFEVLTRPVVVDMGKDRPRYFNSGRLAIVRSDNDGSRSLLGTVTEDYTLIGPQEFAAIWDEIVAQPVGHATMIGSRLVISTPLQSFGIGKDEVENYFVAVNPMDGLHASFVMVTPVKVVCVNTLILGLALATMKFRVVHDRYARERLASWLLQAWEAAGPRVQSIEKVFKAMSKAKVEKPAVERVLEIAFPDPKRPEKNAPDDVMKTRIERWDYLKGRQIGLRTAAFDLYQGGGTGFEGDRAMNGTAWGLYNAIAEFADYRQTKDEDDVDSVTDSLLFGERANEKRRGFEAIVKVAEIDVRKIAA